MLLDEIRVELDTNAWMVERDQCFLQHGSVSVRIPNIRHYAQEFVERRSPHSFGRSMTARAQESNVVEFVCSSVHECVDVTSLESRVVLSAELAKVLPDIPVVRYLAAAEVFAGHQHVPQQTVES